MTTCSKTLVFLLAKLNFSWAHLLKPCASLYLATCVRIYLGLVLSKISKLNYTQLFQAVKWLTFWNLPTSCLTLLFYNMERKLNFFCLRMTLANSPEERIGRRRLPLWKSQSQSICLSRETTCQLNLSWLNSMKGINILSENMTIDI